VPAPAPVATPEPAPAAVPAPPPAALDLNLDLNGVMDGVNQSLAQLDMDAIAEQARAYSLDSQMTPELAAQIRDSALDRMDIQSEKYKDLLEKQKEKALELRDKALEMQAQGRMFAQNMPTPPQPPLVMRQPAGRAQGGVGAGVGVGVGRGIVGRNTSEDRLYENGKNSLDNHRFDDALAAFSEIVSRGGAKVEGALYYKAYTLNKLGRRDEAISTIAELRKTYPKSRWLDDAGALEVEVKQAAGKPVSPEELNDDDLKIYAASAIMQTDPDRAFPSLEGLLKGSHSPALKIKIVYLLAQNQSPKAQALLEQIARGSTGNPDLQLKAVSYFVDIRNKPNRAQLLAEVYAGSNDIALKRAIIETFSRNRDIEHLGQIAKTEKNGELRDSAIGMLGEVDGQPELWQLYTAETTPEGKKSLLKYMYRNGNSDKLIEVARTDKDPSVRSTAINVLASHKGPNITAAMVAIYGSEQEASVKRTIIGTLADQRDAKALIDIGRKEKDIELKRQIVRRLADMHTPEATDFLLEVLK
jgi:TolA-binding protein